MQKTDYKLIYGSESYPGMGLQILASDVDIDFTSEEYCLSPAARAVRKAAQDIEQALTRYSNSKDPKQLEFKIKERESLLACFAGKAGEIQELTNGYCFRACCSERPWYKVMTLKGPIVIGWRKKVIHIGWDPALTSLSVQDDTTAGEDFIHAWGYDKATEYIGLLRAKA